MGMPSNSAPYHPRRMGRYTKFAMNWPNDVYGLPLSTNVNVYSVNE